MNNHPDGENWRITSTRNSPRWMVNGFSFFKKKIYYINNNQEKADARFGFCYPPKAHGLKACEIGTIESWGGGRVYEVCSRKYISHLQGSGNITEGEVAGV